MATLVDVLHHLVTHAPNLSDENRAEFHAAVNELEEDDAPEEPKAE